MTIKYISIVSMMLFSFYGFSQTGIEGKWKNEENGIDIEIYSQNNMFFGKTISVTNADSGIKAGHLLLNNLVYNILTKKYKGRVKLTSGFTAHCELELINGNKFQLTVTKLFIRKVQIFTRLE